MSEKKRATWTHAQVAALVAGFTKHGAGGGRDAVAGFGFSEAEAHAKLVELGLHKPAPKTPVLGKADTDALNGLGAEIGVLHQADPQRALAFARAARKVAQAYLDAHGPKRAPKAPELALT